MATGIFLPIVSQFIDKGTTKAIKELKSLETVSQKAGYAINKAALPAAAALTGLAAAGFSAAKAAAADAEAQTKLAGQIRRTTGSTQEQINAAEDLISSLSMSAAVADDALRPALSSLVTGTKDLGTAQRLLKVALDVSAGAGLDLQSTSDALSKGFAGNTRALAALSPELKVLIKEGASFSEVLEVLEKNFGGAAEEAGNTAAGSMRKFEIAVDEAQESLGNALLPILKKVTPILTDLATIVQNNSGLFVIFATALGSLAGGLVAARIAMAAYRTVAIATTVVNKALAISGFAVQISTGVGIASAIAGAAALGGLAYAVTRATAANNDLAASTANANTEQEESNSLLLEYLNLPFSQRGEFLPEFLRRRRAEIAAAEAEEIRAAEAAEKAAAKALKRAEEIRQKIARVRDGINRDISSARKAAEDALKEAQRVFTDFASSVSDAITGAFSFGEAEKAAKETGTTFLNALEEQVKKVRDYAVLINRLIAAGLNESALSQVLAAGQDAGTAIATELLNGGAAAITKANALSDEVTTLGQNVGNNAAVQFKTAGITAAQGLIAGIESVISKYQLKLKSKKLTPKQLANLQKNFGVDVDFVLSGGGVPALADGGIVRASSGGTLALIGEGGQDEAVIPLDRLNASGGGSTIIIQGAVDPITTARQIEKILSGQVSRFGY